MRRIQFFFKKEDAWIGCYWDLLSIFVCPLPFCVIKIGRKLKPSPKNECFECGAKVWECECN